MPSPDLYLFQTFLIYFRSRSQDTTRSEAKTIERDGGYFKPCESVTPQGIRFCFPTGGGKEGGGTFQSLKLVVVVVFGCVASVVPRVRGVRRQVVVRCRVAVVVLDTVCTWFQLRLKWDELT